MKKNNPDDSSGCFLVLLGLFIVGVIKSIFDNYPFIFILLLAVAIYFLIDKYKILNRFSNKSPDISSANSPAAVNARPKTPAFDSIADKTYDPVLNSIDVVCSFDDEDDDFKTRCDDSLLEFPSDYTVVDLETTGLSPIRNNIIEIACIKYRDGEEIDRYQTLVQPTKKNGTFISKRIIGITGITNEMLGDAPSFNEISSSVWDFLKDELVIGHNVSFDMGFLRNKFKEENNLIFDNDSLDTLRLARRLLSKDDVENHKLGTLADYFDIDIPQHRALNDCLITNEVYNQLSILADCGYAV